MPECKGNVIEVSKYSVIIFST